MQPRRLVTERTIAGMPYSAAAYNPPYPYPLYAFRLGQDPRLLIAGNAQAARCGVTATTNFAELSAMFKPAKVNTFASIVEQAAIANANVSSLSSLTSRHRSRSSADGLSLPSVDELFAFTPKETTDGSIAHGNSGSIRAHHEHNVSIEAGIAFSRSARTSESSISEMSLPGGDGGVTQRNRALTNESLSSQSQHAGSTHGSETQATSSKNPFDIPSPDLAPAVPKHVPASSGVSEELMRELTRPVEAASINPFDSFAGVPVPVMDVQPSTADHGMAALSLDAVQHGVVPVQSHTPAIASIGASADAAGARDSSVASVPSSTPHPMMMLSSTMPSGYGMMQNVVMPGYSTALPGGTPDASATMPMGIMPHMMAPMNLQQLQMQQQFMLQQQMQYQQMQHQLAAAHAAAAAAANAGGGGMMLVMGPHGPVIVPTPATMMPMPSTAPVPVSTPTQYTQPMSTTTPMAQQSMLGTASAHTTPVLHQTPAVPPPVLLSAPPPPITSQAASSASSFVIPAQSSAGAGMALPPSITPTPGPTVSTSSMSPAIGQAVWSSDLGTPQPVIALPASGTPAAHRPLPPLPDDPFANSTSFPSYDESST